ncbi:MAG: hypothetical protein ACFFCU_20700, partial [Promethearchaeota archaeon]
MKNTSQTDHKRKFPLLVSLGIIHIIILSGCIQTPPVSEPDQTEPAPEPPQPEILFDPNQAEFYNPITNITEQLWIKNHNNSWGSFYHQNQIELVTGLRDAKGNPGVNYSLVVTIVYIFYGEPEIENLSAKLGILLKTNKSGIARYTFTYDQYTWPHGVNTEGHLEVSCNKIPNVTAISRLFTFRYHRKQITRNSTSEEGVEVIYEFENTSLYEEAIALGNGENDYVNWTEDYDTPVFIDASTIRMRSQYGGAPYEEFMYRAWALHLDPINTSTQNIRAKWDEYIKKDLPSFSGYKWKATGALSKVNVSKGWLILQYMYEDTFTNGLDARTLWYYQLAILDDNLHLHWLI